MSSNSEEGAPPGAEAQRGYGRFRTLDEVARGGMGVILRGWDEDLRRNIALKVLHDDDRRPGPGEGSLRPKAIAARFREEAQVTGQLEHPGVVPIHEMGTDDDGHPFFAMRLIKGRTFGDVIDLVSLDLEGWTLTRALGALLKACEAIAYAQDKGVVHRDLKPANIMVGRFGETYVMDWGLAKVLGRENADERLEDSALSSVTIVHTDRKEESDSETMYGDVVGTPSYMPPEQALGKVDEIGVRTDVYALGAILYHLLSGNPPYVETGARVPGHLLLKWVVDGPPKALDEVAPQAPGELSAICEKAMSRDPRGRYESAQALAHDLRAYLEGRVVSAYEGGAVAEFKKWVTRNKGTAIASAAAVLAAVGAFAGITWIQVRSQEVLQGKNAELGETNAALESTIAELGEANAEIGTARDAAHQNAALAQRNEREAVLESYASNLHAAANALAVGASADAWASLQACPEELRGWEWSHLDLRTDPSLAVLGPVEARLLAVAWSPSGRLIAGAGGDLFEQGYDFDVRIWDAETFEELVVLSGHRQDVQDLAFSPDGSQLVTVGGDGRWKLWDVTAGDELFDGFTGNRPTDVEFFPDGESIAIAHFGGAVTRFDVRSGATLAHFECGTTVKSVAIFPDGERLVAGLDYERVLVWDVRRRTVERELVLDAIGTDPVQNMRATGINGLAVDATGTRIAASADTRGIAVWDADSGEQLARMSGPNSAARALAFHPNGLWLVSGAINNTVTLWDAIEGDEIEVLLGHDWVVSSLDFSPRGDRLVSASYDGTLRLWDGQPGSVASSFRGMPVWSLDRSTLSWSPDGARIAWRPHEEVVILSDANTGERLVKYDALQRIRDAAFSPDGERLLVVASDDDETPEPWSLLTFDVETGDRIAEVRSFATHDFHWGAFHPSGLMLVTARETGLGHLVEVWDVATGELVHALEGHQGWVARPRFLLEDDLMFTASSDRTVRLWSLATGELVHLVEVGYPVSHFELLPPASEGELGTIVASAGDHRDKFLRIFDLTTGELLREIRCSSTTSRMDVSPDGERIAAAQLDGGVGLIHPERGEIVRLRGHDREIVSVAFSPDGLRLASQDSQCSNRIWETVHPRDRAPLREGAIARRARAWEIRDIYEDALAEALLPELAAEAIAAGSAGPPELREEAVRLARRSTISYFGEVIDMYAALSRPDASAAEGVRVQEAVERMRGLLAEDATEASILGLALARQGKAEEALEAVRDHKNNNIFAACAAALACYELGELETARAHATQVRYGADHLSGGPLVAYWAQLLREIDRLLRD